jgi:replicative DNA helicase
MNNTQPFGPWKNPDRYLKSFSQLYEKIGSSQYLPPQALEVEQSILGAMITEKNCVSIVSEVIKNRREVFYRDAHGDVYESILALYDEGITPDLLTVTEKLRFLGLLEAVGGNTYLVELTQKVVTTANVEAHSRLILEKFIARELIRVSEETKLRAFVGEDDTFQLLEMTERNVFALSEERHTRAAETIASLVAEVSSEQDKIAAGELKAIGVPSGLMDLDTVTHGWQKTDLIIIAARPSQGKTALALELSRAASKNGYPVGLFSLEMGGKQIARRLLAAEGGFSMNAYRDNRVLREKRDAAEASLSKLRIHIDDTAGITPLELRSKARKMKARYGIGLLIVDYLQLMEGGKNFNTRDEEIGHISRNLKSIAKELNIPVIALSQLNRQVETRSATDKEPVLADLRESGNIEADADIVLFIHRPEVYGITTTKCGNPSDNVATLSIGKHRNGSLARFDTRFDGAYQRFENYGVRIPAFDNGLPSPKGGSDW